MNTPIADENISQQVKAAAQITDIIGECVVLKRSGVNLKGRCPFHAEKTPSFTVSPVRQTFHCFGCGEGGDVYSFLMKYYNLTFPEALQELARRYHITLPEKSYGHADEERSRKRQALFAANEKAAELYHDQLFRSADAGRARRYLKERGIPVEALKTFRLGFAPDSWDYLAKQLGQAGIDEATAVDAGLLVRKEKGGTYDRFRNRILFPIFDQTGKVAGFGGRILGDGEPKYLNSPESPVFDKSRILLGLYQHRDAIRRRKMAVIVEGNFDMLSLAVHGIDYVVAPLGTALTQQQIRILKGFVDEVILLFDGDAAGLAAALRAVPLFLSEQVAAKIAVLPSSDDPDTYIRAHGHEGLEKLLHKALPLLEFVFDRLVEKYGLSMEGKGRILEELQPLIEAMAGNPLQRSVLVSQFSEKLQLDPAQVLQGFQASGGGRLAGRAALPTPEKPLSLPQKQRHLLEFLIFHPEFLDKFLDAGIEQLLIDPAAGTILAHLRQLHGAASQEQNGPEHLLQLLPDGPQKAFVSELLINTPAFSMEEDFNPEAVADEMLAWMSRDRLKLEMAELTRRIVVAQKSANQEELLALIQEKQQLGKLLEVFSR